MKKLLIATNNQGKIREYAEIFADLPLELTYLSQEGIELDVAETGQTFTENAVLKAQTYAQASGLLTLADDSGLEVDALEGAPGVFSARYAGEGASDIDRYQLLLRNLSDVPDGQRQARFRCVTAIALPGGEVYTAEGIYEGEIARAPRGDNGFGYDPVFYMPKWGKTMAELPAETKNRISHRGRAAVGAREILLQLIGGN